MQIRSRLILLLACLLVIFAAASWLLQAAQRKEAQTIRASVEQQRSALLDRLLELTGQSLHTFARDYSLWDEMLAFVQTGDREWARINLDASLPNFDCQAAWVLRVDGSLVYQSGELDPKTLALLPLHSPAFLEKLCQDRTLHFFLDTPAGLLEMRTQPIQPSEDITRTSPPRGWLVVSRLWSEQHVETLAEAMQGEFDFQRLPDRPDDPAIIHLERNLHDWNGRLVRTLHAAYRSRALAELLAGNANETIVLFLFGAVMITLTGLSLSRWVITPLQQLGHSLEIGRPEPLQSLQKSPSEFGHLARLVAQSFAQRQALEHEVRERTRMAEALQEAGTQLRASNELRSRLARDLHDGVIQSIYAAGLGLEGVRSNLLTDPADADRRVAACQAALNDTIHGLRTFINGLESEATPDLPFSQTLVTLVATMRAVQPGNITLEVDETVARRISPAQELQLIHVLRESISNALRHAGPAVIHLSLQGDAAHHAILVVSDNGCGFPPDAIAGRGHGLINLGIRARDMGGKLLIDSSPGNGTRITLRFNPTYPPCP
jgi:signal transduction histidine kinase